MPAVKKQNPFAKAPAASGKKMPKGKKSGAKC